MVLSAVWFSINYLFVKLATGVLPYFVLTFGRFLIPALILLGVLCIEGRFLECFRVQKFHTHLVRALAVTVAQFSIFYYISQSSLLNATVLLNTGPLFIPLLDYLLHGHPMGKSTWISLIVGFTGVVLILQPGADLFSWLSLVGLLAGLSQGLSQVLYGYHSTRESLTVNLFLLYGLCSLMSVIPLIIWGVSTQGGWPHVPAIAWLFLLFLCIANIFNQYFRGLAYRLGGKPTTLSTFIYLSIVFASFFDWTVFGTIPNLYSVIGAICVVGAGFLKILLRWEFLHRSKK